MLHGGGSEIRTHDFQLMRLTPWTARLYRYEGGQCAANASSIGCWSEPTLRRFNIPRLMPETDKAFGWPMVTACGSHNPCTSFRSVSMLDPWITDTSPRLKTLPSTRYGRWIGENALSLSPFTRSNGVHLNYTLFLIYFDSRDNLIWSEDHTVVILTYTG